MLTIGERAKLERFRKGWNQHEAAAGLGMTRWQYQRYEKLEDEKRRISIPIYEWCRIQRWRSKETIDDVAKALEGSRLWIIRMEAGLANSTELYEYWKLRGSAQS